MKITAEEIYDLNTFYLQSSFKPLCLKLEAVVPCSKIKRARAMRAGRRLPVFAGMRFYNSTHQHTPSFCTAPQNQLCTGAFFDRSSVMKSARVFEIVVAFLLACKNSTNFLRLQGLQFTVSNLNNKGLNVHIFLFTVLSQMAAFPHLTK